MMDVESSFILPSSDVKVENWLKTPWFNSTNTSVPAWAKNDLTVF